jgi:hypothetical protein
MITVMFSCKVCGLSKVKVLVKSREPTESILGWMDREVRPQAMKEHTRKSLFCNGPISISIPAASDRSKVGMEDEADP